MTSNQLQFWKQEEEKRHNAEVEKETKRHNIRMEEVGFQQASAAILGANTTAFYAADYAQAALWGASAQLTNAGASWLNAQTNAATAPYNAETNRIDAETRKGQLELGWAKHNQDIVQWQADYGRDWFQTLIGSGGIWALQGLKK